MRVMQSKYERERNRLIPKAEQIADARIRLEGKTKKSFEWRKDVMLRNPGMKNISSKRPHYFWTEYFHEAMTKLCQEKFGVPA